MIFLKVIKIGLVMGFALITASNVNATLFSQTVTLDNIVANNSNLPGNQKFRFQNLPSYTEGDFNISVNCTNCVNAFDPSEVGNNGWSSGRFLETWNTSAIFTLTQNNGRMFNFTGWDMGWYNNNTLNANWGIRAYDANGNQIGNQDNYTGIGSVAFNYLNVESIQIQNRGGFSSFDNLQVSFIPEPGTWALFALGFGFVVRLNRRS